MNHIILNISNSSLNNKLLAYKVQGQENMSQSYNYTLQCYTELNEIKPQDLLGKEVCCTIDDNKSKNKRIIHGIVAKFHFIGKTASTKKSFYNYELIVESSLCLNDFMIHSRVYKDTPVDDISKKICQEAGLSVRAGNLENENHYKKPYLIQYNESNTFFLSRILKEVGLFYFFTHDEHSHTLNLIDSHQDYLKLPSYDETDIVFTSKPSYEIGPTEVKFSNYNFDEQNPIKVAEEKIPVDFEHTVPVSIFQDTDNQKSSPDFNLRLFKETLVAEKTAHTGETKNVLFRPGYYFDLKDKGGFVITNCAFYAEDSTHLPQGHNFRTHTTFRCIPKTQEFRGAEKIPSPKIFGNQTAKVVSNEGDGPVDTDEYGRVFVNFHWDENKSPVQIRTTQPWAGSNKGFQFTPHIGDEVLVSFINGDPEHSIIVGSLYNYNNDSKFEPKNKPLVQGLMTKRNNSLLFTDEEGKEHVQVGAQKDFTLNAKETSNFQQQELNMIADKKVNITGPKSAALNINEKGDVVMGHDSGKMEISQNGDFKFEAKNGLTVKAAQGVTMQAPFKVKGSVDAKIGG